MKKLLLGILILFTYNVSAEYQPTTYVFNKTANAIEHVYLDGTKVVEKAYSLGTIAAPKIGKALETLASQLKVSADNVWKILVRQQLVWSFGTLICIFVTLFSWIHFYRRLRIWHNDTRDKYVSACVITCVLALAGTILCSMHFMDMLTGFINPEFGAMKTIAEIASQIK